MSYYRAALAAARVGDLTAAARLVKCSLLFCENAPSAIRLSQLLESRAAIDSRAMNDLRSLVDAREYKKALKVKLPRSTKGHTIRGLIMAKLGRRRAARREFALALALDTGNNLARRLLLMLSRR